jgi:hypothetical protein
MLDDESFVCDQHRSDSDVAIAGDVVVRRVRLQVDVLLTGTSPDKTAAQLEAFARLDRLVRQLGGFLELGAVSAQIVRYPAERQGTTPYGLSAVGR